jgi:hypothetical protein
MEKIKKIGLLYLSIDAVYQISLKSEMVGWTIVFWLDDLVWNVSDTHEAKTLKQRSFRS